MGCCLLSSQTWGHIGLLRLSVSHKGNHNSRRTSDLVSGQSVTCTMQIGRNLTSTRCRRLERGIVFRRGPLDRFPFLAAIFGLTRPMLVAMSNKPMFAETWHAAIDRLLATLDATTAYWQGWRSGASR